MSSVPSVLSVVKRTTTEDTENTEKLYFSWMRYETLPGYAMVRDGLRDLAEGRESEAALLVLIGAPRLRGIGIDVPLVDVDFPEHRLYALLAVENSDAAHSRYNALIRELVSFERAAECAA
jgi:hypothetical protein